MKILGIETSCDETGVAVLEAIHGEKQLRICSNVVATSLAKHALTGGIIPEVAAREQVTFMQPVLTEALLRAGLTTSGKPDIDAIAVTYGPGLIGSLLVGVETAKTLALLWNVPLIPVNHMYGHIYANWIDATTNPGQPTAKSQLSEVSSQPSVIAFPALALVVSGGHTDLVLLESHGQLKVIGGTRDDAAGEAFDKIGRLLGLPYPAGPVISRLAESGNPKAFRLPRPMWDSKDYDFSFSGLKTSVLNLVKKHQWDFTKQPLGNDEQLLADLCASVQQAIIDVLVFKTLSAAKMYQVKTLLLAGGVAANKHLTGRFQTEVARQFPDVAFHVPPPSLCSDNGAMFAAGGYFNNNSVWW